MKATQYEIKNNMLTAKISRGIVTKFDWILEITTNCGGQLIGEYQQLHLTRKAAISEFNNFRAKGYLIRVY